MNRPSKFNQWKEMAESADLSYWFSPTIFVPPEMGKAYYKNANLPILQFIYNGDPQEPLKCMISGTPGFEWTINYGHLTERKLRFNIEFNHVRQRKTDSRSGGISVDKSESPCQIFRRTVLTRNLLFIAEFLTIMPVSPLYHSHITQDSQISDIILDSFPKENWIWALRTPENWKQVCERFEIELDYQWFIDHMNDINAEPIFKRLK